MNETFTTNDNGFKVISNFDKNGVLITFRFLYYTKKDALTKFRKLLKEHNESL